MEFSHVSVLLTEAINALQIKSNGIYVDGTAGGGGHSFEIAKRLSGGRLIALDRDPDAIAAATQRLSGLSATVVQSNFKDFDVVLDSLQIERIDGMLLDLGVSSWQLDAEERGFSYHGDAPLDMRMSKQGITAADLVNTLDSNELTKIFRDYGEEKFAYKIATNIVTKRAETTILTTEQLANIIRDSVPAKVRREGHPARKCFQALRIAVNGELDAVSEVLEKAFNRLEKDGVLAVITFHSLEDRIVKRAFAEFCTGCTCPPDFPICVCGKTPKGRLPFRKPIEPGLEEVKNNPRSRSAKLRAIQKL